MPQAVILSQSVTGTVDTGAKNLPANIGTMYVSVAFSAAPSPVNVFDLHVTLYRRAKPSDAWAAYATFHETRNLDSATVAVTSGAEYCFENVGGWQVRGEVSVGQSVANCTIVAAW